ncbi:MAG: ASCH domain-containing protein [Candidatus Berkelbacteria bacterium]|nr:ASCH domain-containing protein [Candidatus Berkelbacteria bacterium]
MKIISIHKQDPYYSMVINGLKTVEGRLNKGKFAEIEIGDVLMMLPGGKKFRVIGKRKYKTFKEMLKSEGIKNILPDQDNVEDAIKIYRRFYKKSEEKKFGALAIRIKRI